MVLVGKIFRVEGDMAPELAAEKLRGWRVERSVAHGGEEFTLRTQVDVKTVREAEVWGELYEEYLVPLFGREGVRYEVSARVIPFIMFWTDSGPMLLILAKRPKANAAASLLSNALLLGSGGIVEAKISHETLRELHESNPEAAKVVYFDQVDLPNIRKLSLFGEALADTNLYQEYLKHGKIWYVVFEDREWGLTVGVTRNCVVTVFTATEVENFVRYVMERIVPLVEPLGSGET
ncbi:MAG: hypothetical protein QI223_06920 [Candidatus Korarchaeota archaeon]|nr:hypothetical protein [Candidatus Korarchaeota archaeon]